MRRIVLAAAVVLLGAVAALAFVQRVVLRDDDRGDGGDRPPPRVEVIHAQERSITEERAATGTLSSPERVRVTAERAGRVEEIAFEEGRAVARGERLVALDRAREEAAVADARARVEEAEHDLARRRELERSDFSAEARVEDAETELTRARAALSVARENLDAMTIEAPFAGVTGTRRVSPGALVEPGTAITELRVTDPLELRFEVPGSAAGAVREGLDVRAESEARPDRTFRGRVHFVAPEVDEATRTLTLEARIEDPEGLLKPGMFVSVRVVVDERRVVTVPEESLVTRGPGTFVYRVDDADVVHRVPVSVGVRRAGWIELRDGATAGDRVVVAGQQGVQDGAAVRVVRDDDAP